MGRAPCCDKSNVKRGPWAPEEDTLLKNYLEKHGPARNWIALPRKAGLKRCGKSCRLRWLNYLRPDIKHGGFTEEEDNIICTLYNSIGSRWSVIASKLPGRTDNDVKNYWNTSLKKKFLAGKVSLINSSSSNNNDHMPTNNTAHLNSTQVSPSFPEFGNFEHRNSTYFIANSGTLSYVNDIIYQQNLGPHEEIISLDPNQVTFTGLTGVPDYHASTNNNSSTMLSPQEASSLSMASSLTMESSYLSWSVNGDIDEQGSLLELGFAEYSPYEPLNGFDFQKASSEIDPNLGNYCPFRN